MYSHLSTRFPCFVWHKIFHVLLLNCSLTDGLCPCHVGLILLVGHDGAKNFKDMTRCFGCAFWSGFFFRISGQNLARTWPIHSSGWVVFFFLDGSGRVRRVRRSMIRSIPDAKHVNINTFFIYSDIYLKGRSYGSNTDIPDSMMLYFFFFLDNDVLHNKCWWAERGGLVFIFNFFINEVDQLNK